MKCDSKPHTELRVTCAMTDNLQTTWYHLDLSEKVTIIRNSVNEVGDEGKPKSRTLRFTNIATVIYL